MKRTNGARAVTGALALAVAAWAVAAWTVPAHADVTLDRLYDAAKAEGKVAIFGPPTALLRQELIDAFTRRFPALTLEYTGLQGGPMANKIKAEARGDVHSVDIILGGADSAIRILKPEKLIQPFESWIVSDDARDPAKWRDGRLNWSDPDRTALPMLEISSPFAVFNAKLVREGEVSRDADLLDPKWKGRIVANDPAVPGNANLGFRRLYELHGPDFLRRLKAQEIVVTKDLRQLLDWVAKGRYAIGLGFSPTSIAYLEQRGGMTEIRVGENQNWADKMMLTPGFGSMSVPAKVAHPNAAKLFVNWILTKEGQGAMVRGLVYPSLRLDVDDSSVPDYLKRPSHGRYYQSSTEEYLTSKPVDDANRFLREIGFGK